MGYSGWAPGQLENELQTGSWLTTPADAALLFDKDPSHLWAEVLRSMGDTYKIYADNLISYMLYFVSHTMIQALLAN